MWEELGFRDISTMLLPGVYALLLRGEVLYVGQSTRLGGRLAEHTRNIVFDQVVFQNCEVDELDELERRMILKLSPKLNIQLVPPGTNLGPKKPLVRRPRDKPTPATVIVSGLRLVIPVSRPRHRNWRNAERQLRQRDKHQRPTLPKLAFMEDRLPAPYYPSGLRRI